MKILFTSHFFFPSVGGIEVISEILSNYFSREGNTIRLITKTRGFASEDIKKYDFLVIRNPSIQKLLECYHWADVIFQNNIEIRLLWPNLFFRKPLVIGLQTWIRSSDGHRGLLESVKRMSLASASRLIACSHVIRLDSSHTAEVIGNPYDSDLFRNLSIKRRPRSIVFLGRLVSDKGADLLITSLAMLNDCTVSLTIIGDGPERAFLESLVLKLKLVHNVRFAGGLQGAYLVEELNKHEIMVVPSLWKEPFGIVALEGLACGCVLLASDGGGLSDAVGNAGLLFKRGDSADLVHNLQRLLDNPNLRSSLLAQAHSHLKAFGKECVASRYLAVLESTVNDNSL